MYIYIYLVENLYIIKTLLKYYIVSHYYTLFMNNNHILLEF